jgi:hypothetical protein
MAYRIRRVEYYYTTVEDQPGEAYKFLSRLKDLGVSLLAFTAIPVGPIRTQMTLFPEESARLETAASGAGMTLDGPHPALLVQGDDELGALVDVHQRLYQSRVNVYASNAVTDGKGSYGYVLYIRAEDYPRAVAALEV